MPNAPVILIVLDGFGVSPEKKGNAIQLSNSPTIRMLEKRNRSQLLANGKHVGLPGDLMGNSEVGHTNIGAGRIVYQDSARINNAIEDNSFFSNRELLKAFEKVNQNDAKLHLMGLVSDGGVHSFNHHLFALIKAAKQNGIKKLYVHCFLDGRDTPPKSSPKYLKELEAVFKQNDLGDIATVTGRFWGMDRDTRWDRTQKSYEALTLAKGSRSKTALDAVSEAHQKGQRDEFIEPIIIKPEGMVEDKDGIIFFNFRPDRARQMSRAFTEEKFEGFKRSKIDLSCFVSMTKYDQSFLFPSLFPPQTLSHILAEEISQAQIAQLRVAETEKYAHVTYFFNGGIEKPFDGEERILIPSTREVPTYDLQPKMSAPEITHAVIENIKKDKFGFIAVNYANADMVGHTGDLQATIQAVEVIDQCLKKIIDAVQKKNGHVLITADHGNAEQMFDPSTGEIHTAHTKNPVPFYYVSPHQTKVTLKDGILSDMMPTILTLMGLPYPKEVTGKNLIVG